jgi:hypothetical protein
LTEPQKDEGRSIPAVIGTALLLAGFVLQFFSVKQNLPFEVQIASALIVGVSAILFLVWVWYRPIRGWYQIWKRNRIARRNMPELFALLDRFRQFVDSGITQPYFFLYQLKGRGTAFSSLPLPMYPYYPQMFAANLSVGSKNRKSNLDTFRWLSDSFANLIQYFNETYLSSPVKEVLNIIKKASETEAPPDVPAVPEDIRKGFSLSRARWVRFLQDLEEFTSRVSKQLGQYQVKLGNDWHGMDYVSARLFEPPEELPMPTDL